MYGPRGLVVYISKILSVVVYTVSDIYIYIPVRGSIKAPRWVITTIQLDRAALLLYNILVITQ